MNPSSHYDRVIAALSSKGIRAEFHRADQLVLPSRIWLTWQGQWYVSTWVPACYRVPTDVDIVALCQECLQCDGGSFYTIPDFIVARYRLQRLTNDELDALFAESDDDDESVEA